MKPTITAKISDLEILTRLTKGWRQKDIADSENLRHCSLHMRVYRLIGKCGLKTIDQLMYQFGKGELKFSPGGKLWGAKDPVNAENVSSVKI